jgi:adenine-specific DNA-methyltransferase
VAIDFISARRGVFEDVLQEALLATYRKDNVANGTAIHYLSVKSDISAGIAHAGRFVVPTDAQRPWLVPRLPEHQALVERLAEMPCRLSDWGYQVSTGPLVWNRFKTQLRSKPGDDVFPLVWAEAVAGPDRFIHRAEKRHHAPYFHARDKDAWLKVSVPCVLVQRTTATEQPRRLIAAAMPQSFIEAHGAVIVENHLNMIRPIAGKTPRVSTAALSALINSGIADAIFRCISGSVAVSAFELEALPVPSTVAMAEVEKLVGRGADTKMIESTLREIYLGGSKNAS